MAYIKPIDGYIVDVPNATFIRNDGKIFYYNKLASCNFSPSVEPMEINGGQGLYPLASIPTGASAEVTLTSAEFRADMFVLAHNVDATEATDEAFYETKRYDVETGLTITLPVGATKPYVRGFEVAAIAAAGKFSFATNKITFFAGDVAVGDTIMVTYEIVADGTLIPAGSDGATASGSLQLEYPVYSGSGDTGESARKGTLILTIFRVKATTLPGFDSSYKTAITNGITFAAMDAERADGRMWKWFYRPLN